jgi:hypothetical protein
MRLKATKINAELKLFCPRRGCLYFQSPDNKIIKEGMTILHMIRHSRIMSTVIYLFRMMAVASCSSGCFQ